MSAHHQPSNENLGRNLLYSILINIGITVSQFIGGLLSGSLALLSDALHNFSDVVSLIISYIANRLSKRKADFTKTFGYKRAEIIAAFINAATLIILAVYLIKESISRFFAAPENIDSTIVIWLAVVSIIGNGICVLLLMSGSKENMNVKSSYLHLLTDMFTSVVVLIGGILMKYYGILWIDSLLTFLIGAYLIYMGFDLLKSSFKVLMLFSPDDINMKKLVKDVNKIEGVKSIHHVHIWLLNEYEVHLEAHLDMKADYSLTDFQEILHKIEDLVLEKYGINHVNLQPEFQKEDPKEIIVQD